MLDHFEDGPDGPSLTVLGRANGRWGETVLRQRGEVLELVVDGVFAMDSAHTSTEEALARLALERVGGPDLAVVVGGLGLGYTARAAAADPRVRRLVVVELDASLVEWAQLGLVPVAASVLADPRTELVTGDVRTALPALGREAAHVVLLDVDNGPGFLVHTANADLYSPAFLATCAGVLRPGGVLAVWSADASTELQQALAAGVGPCEEVLLPVRRDRRGFTYAIYLAERLPRGG